MQNEKNIFITFVFDSLFSYFISLFKHKDLLFSSTFTSAVAYAFVFHDQTENDSKSFHYNFRAGKSNNFSFRFSSVKRALQTRFAGGPKSVAKKKRIYLWMKEKCHKRVGKQRKSECVGMLIILLGMKNLSFVVVGCCNTRSWPFLLRVEQWLCMPLMLCGYFINSTSMYSY